MAISQAVVFGLVALVGLSSFLTVMGVYQKSQAEYNYALKVYRENVVDAAQTSIHILSVTVTSNTLILKVSNNGSTSLYEYGYFALVVDYYANVSGSAVLVVSLYKYSSSPTAYEWTSLTGELYPSSVGEFKVVLPYPPYAGREARIALATNYGPGAFWSGTL
jgi:hypothetical protein